MCYSVQYIVRGVIFFVCRQFDNFLCLYDDVNSIIFIWRYIYFSIPYKYVTIFLNKFIIKLMLAWNKVFSSKIIMFLILIIIVYTIYYNIEYVAKNNTTFRTYDVYMKFFKLYSYFRIYMLYAKMENIITL